MRESIKFQIFDSLRRLQNAKTKADQIRLKIEKLQEELTILDKKVSQEIDFIASIGMKEPSREAGKPDSEKELQAKETFNRKLSQEKTNLLETADSSKNFFNREENQSIFAKAISKLRGEES